tara:strand:+ start:4990 stop:5361 length:372 start_codon:yes stop_codon:yes gene_type:complete
MNEELEMLWEDMQHEDESAKIEELNDLVMTYIERYEHQDAIVNALESNDPEVLPALHNAIMSGKFADFIDNDVNDLLDAVSYDNQNSPVYKKAEKDTEWYSGESQPSGVYNSRGRFREGKEVD